MYFCGVASVRTGLLPRGVARRTSPANLRNLFRPLPASRRVIEHSDRAGVADTLLIYSIKALSQTIKYAVRILLPFVFGVGILWWMYRGTDWNALLHAVTYEMNWWWMGVSLIFGVLPQTLRAWRWQLALAPLGERPRRRTCVDAIFLSYASSLVIPRVGEVARCGTLKRCDGISFSKGIGTVVTERLVDSVVVLLFTAVAFLSQAGVLFDFLTASGTDLNHVLSRFTGAGYMVTIACVAAIILLLVGLTHRFALFNKGRDILKDVWDGIRSLRNVERSWLYIAYSVGIWVCYFLHFYLAFFCFDFTSGISPVAAFLIFCIGSFAVLVPTPNGAGSWHFAVKTMLVIYGVAEGPAILFALVVHTIQTFEVALLGIYAWVDLSLMKRVSGKPKTTITK